MSQIRPRPMPDLRDWIDRKEGDKPGRKIVHHGGQLKQRSIEKGRWHLIYVAFLKFLIALDPMCRRCRRRKATEGHHPFGQLGALILCVFPFCRECHDDCHNNPNAARKEGWIRDT